MRKITEKLAYPFVYLARSVSAGQIKRKEAQQRRETSAMEAEPSLKPTEKPRIRVVSYYEPEAGRFVRVYAPLVKILQHAIVVVNAKGQQFQITSDFPLQFYTFWATDGTFALLLMFIEKGKLYPLPATNEYHPDAIQAPHPRDLAGLKARVFENAVVAKLLGEINDLKMDIDFLLGLGDTAEYYRSEVNAYQIHQRRRVTSTTGAKRKPIPIRRKTK